MEMRELGRSGLRVSRLGLGLAALGRPGYINLGHADDLQRDYEIAAMEARAHHVLDAAWAGGIRYIDAARSYGRAEEFLAAWLSARDLAPDALTVGSKWGYTYTAGWQVTAEHHEIKDHSLATLERQISESRGWLGEHLDLYQIHSATLDSGVLDDGAVHDRLRRLRADGVAIGLSLSGPRQAETLRRALEIRGDGESLFNAVQATWNLLEPSVGPALAEAHAAGVGVIVKEALANGRLAARTGEASRIAAHSRLAATATDLGCTLDALALAAALAQPWADVVLSGAATVEHLASNLRAVQVGWTAEIGARLANIAETPEHYWATRAQLDWN